MDIESILEMYEDDYNPGPRPMAQGGRIGFKDGTKLKDLTTNQRQSNINKFISKNSKKIYDNLSDASKRIVQLGQKVVIDKKTQYVDTPKGKLREYVKNLPSGSTVNRQELAKKFGIKKESMGNVTEVFQEFPNKNFKFEQLSMGPQGPQIKPTQKQKNLAPLLFGKKYDDLLINERSKITSGRFTKDTMTPYRRSKIYDPIALKNYGKKWNDLIQKEKDRVRAGLPPVDPNRVPVNKAAVQKELLELSKDPEIMNIFENPNRTKSQYTKDLTKVKKILGKNTNAVARLTQLAAAVSGDTPVPGISTKLKEGANVIYNNLPHTKTQRELDELKIGKSVSEKSIKTTKSQIRKAPGYVFSGDYNIDEVAGATSSVRRGTTPYGIFGQIIQRNINKKDKMSFDGNKSKKEKILQDAIKTKNPKLIDEALKDFNKLVSDYEQKINKDIPKGDLKIKLFKASLDSPKNTIKNFDDFNPEYKKAFLNNYKNKGYSFNVPKDIKTIPQIAQDVQSPKVMQKIAERAGAGSSRLYSNPFFDPSLMGKVISDLGKGVNVGLGPTGVIALTKYLEPEGGYDLSRTGDRLGFEIEAALAKPLVSGAVGVTDKIKNPMLRKVAERATLAGMSPALAMRLARVASPVGIASLGLEGLYKYGKYAKNEIERINDMKENDPDAYAEYVAEQQEQMGVSA